MLTSGKGRGRAYGNTLPCLCNFSVSLKFFQNEKLKNKIETRSLVISNGHLGKIKVLLRKTKQWSPLFGSWG